MSITVPNKTKITIGDVHELSSNDYSKLFIEVSRRHEPGAGRFDRACFLSPKDTDTALFDSANGLLSFIDDIHDDGLIAALGHRIGGDPSVDEILSHLHIGGNTESAPALFESAGMNDPMSLSITIYKETKEEIKPGTSDRQSPQAEV